MMSNQTAWLQIRIICTFPAVCWGVSWYEDIKTLYVLPIPGFGFAFDWSKKPMAPGTRQIRIL